MAQLQQALVMIVMFASLLAAQGAAPPTIEGIWLETYQNDTYTVYCTIGRKLSVYHCQVMITNSSTPGPLDYTKNNFFTGRVIKTGPRPTYSATWYTSEYVDNLTIASNGKTMVESGGNVWKRLY